MNSPTRPPCEDVEQFITTMLCSSFFVLSVCIFVSTFADDVSTPEPMRKSDLEISNFGDFEQSTTMATFDEIAAEIAEDIEQGQPTMPNEEAALTDTPAAEFVENVRAEEDTDGSMRVKPVAESHEPRGWPMPVTNEAGPAAMIPPISDIENEVAATHRTVSGSATTFSSVFLLVAIAAFAL